MKKIFYSILLMSIVAFIGCEETSTAIVYQKEVVVNGTLTAGKNIDTLRINWTGEVDRYYDQKDYAISNAIAVVRGVDIDFYDSLVYDIKNPGRYYSLDASKIITPTKTYSLDVSIPGWNHLSAVTTVPDTFRITESTLSDGDTVRYNLLAPVNKFYWSPSKLQATYLPTITYLDEKAPLIPKAFYSDTTSKDFQYPQKISYRVGLPQDQANSDVPWVFLTYFGNIQFDVYAVDFNYSDYINQIIPAQGGEIKDIRFNIKGGIGIFGSRTRANGAIKIYLKP
jgi:hypothetical protein